MKNLKILSIGILLISSLFINAQSSSVANQSNEMEQITSTLNKYIEGSTNGQPKLLEEAFHPDLNLYSMRRGEFSIWSGIDYIADTKQGEPTGEIGKIISIDFENDIGVAKVQISHPESTVPYIDYFMLMKMEGSWKIIHKMYTKRVN